MRDVGLQLRAERGQHGGGLVAGQVRDDDGDHLGVLVGERGDQLLGVGPAERGERPRLAERADPAHDRAGPLLAQGLLEQGARQGGAPADDVALTDRQLVELGEHRLGLAGRQGVQPGDLGGDRLQLLLGQVGEHLGRPVLAELDQHDRGLAGAGLADRRGRAHRSASTSQPRSRAATSSGWRSTSAAISSRAAICSRCASSGAGVGPGSRAGTASTGSICGGSWRCRICSTT